MSAKPAKHSEHTRSRKVFIAGRRTREEGTFFKNGTLRQDEELRKLTHIHVERTLRDGYIPEHAQCSHEVSSRRKKKITECP